VNEVPLRQFRKHLLPDVGHVQLNDREAEYRCNCLRTRCGRCLHDAIAQRGDEQRVFIAERGAIESAAGLEVGEFLLELGTPARENRGPVRLIEGMRLGVPSPQSQPVLLVEQKNLCNDLRVRRRIQPCVVAIGVAL
jgi:hypothetical protein